MMRPYGDDQPIDRRFMHHRHPWPKARRAEGRMRRAQRKTARRGGLLEARKQLGDPSSTQVRWDVDMEYSDEWEAALGPIDLSDELFFGDEPRDLFAVDEDWIDEIDDGHFDDLEDSDDADA